MNIKIVYCASVIERKTSAELPFPVTQHKAA